jgi:hypothetical protein
MGAKSEWGKKLYPIDQVPLHLRFNPFVLSGYRGKLDVWASISSLLYFHNETVNILTHRESRSSVYHLIHLILPPSRSGEPLSLCSVYFITLSNYNHNIVIPSS